MDYFEKEQAQRKEWSIALVKIALDESVKVPL